jgi:ABC-type lipoprotein release transport system permease subunit
MKSLFIFRLILLNTFKRKFRAGLAIGGIALSSSVMVVLFGIGIGLQTLVTDVVAGEDTAGVVTVNQRNQQVKLDQERISTIKSTSGVGSIEQIVGAVADITYHGINLSLPVYGVTEDYFVTSPVSTISGDPKQQPATGSAQVVISKKTAEALSMTPEDAIGKKVSLAVTIQDDHASKQTEESKRLQPQEYTIAAVIDRGALPVGYISLENLVKNGVDSVSQLKIVLTVPDKAASVREGIERLGFQTTSVQDSIEEVDRIFTIIQRILFIFGIIALVITVFGTFNVITLTLIEETSQIGFLRIMGMQKRDVGFMFIAQSIMLTLSGALIGVICGLIFGNVANEIVSLAAVNESIFNEVYVFRAPTIQIIMMLMLSIGLGWLVGAIPAKRAVLINPLEELRS